MLSYNDIYGQDNIKNYLKMIKQKNKIMHAYIINEEKGMGAQELAKVWAAHLLCKNDLNECCKKCHSCIQMKADLHPDFIFISPYKKNSIGVDDIRESINSTLNIMPYMGGYKIYVIKDAHKMTVQAQNALLKTIEEPPEYVIIILLCTNMDMLLETIKSRCIKLRLLPQAEDAIKKNLIKDIDIIVQKPEQLSGNLAGYWSVRIDKANRIVFKIVNNTLEIWQCGSHYRDK